MGSGSWGYVSGQYPGTTPVMPTSWSLMWAGLIPLSQQIQITLDGTYSVQKWSGNNKNFGFIQLPGTNEFFLIEYRYPDGWDAGLTGLTGIANGGIIIYHYDSGQLSCISTNTCNNPSVWLLDVEEADGNQNLETATRQQLQDADLWTGSGTNTFSPTSTPNTNDKSGNPTGITIQVTSNPGASVTSMSFNVSGLGTPPPPDIYVTPTLGGFGCVKIGSSAFMEFIVSNIANIVGNYNEEINFHTIRYFSPEIRRNRDLKGAKIIPDFPIFLKTHFPYTLKFRKYLLRVFTKRKK